MCFLLLLVARGLVCQPQTNSTTKSEKEPYTITAEILSNKVVNGEEITTLTGNVRFVQGPLTGTADKATQNKTTKKVLMEGNVAITQDMMLLKTPKLEYDGNTGISRTESGLFLSDRDASITSQKGSYDMNSQRVDFQVGVKGNQGTAFLSSDSLTYFRTSQTSIARGRAEIKNDSGILRAHKITFVRVTGETIAEDSVNLFNDTTVLYCKHFYDSKSAGLTTASGNVASFDKKNNTILYGDTLARMRDSNLIYVPIRPLLLIIDSSRTSDSLSGETIFRTDTLFVISKHMRATTGDSSRFYAIDSVRMYRLNFAGKGKDMTYDQKTGIMQLAGGGRQKVWYDSTEMVCDSLLMLTVNKKIDRIFGYGKPMLTSPYEDSTVFGRVNQLSSQSMMLTVIKDTVRSLLAMNNALSLYFVSSDGKPSGINRASGDSLRVDFQKNRPERITVIRQTEGEYIPERFVKSRGKAFRLSNYERYYYQKPKREEFLLDWTPPVFSSQDQVR